MSRGICRCGHPRVEHWPDPDSKCLHFYHFPFVRPRDCPCAAYQRSKGPPGTARDAAPSKDFGRWLKLDKAKANEDCGAATVPVPEEEDE